jgi:hypothetical protein
MNNNVIQTPAMEETKYFTLICPQCLSAEGLTIMPNEYDDGAAFVCECGNSGDVEGDLIHEAL